AGAGDRGGARRPGAGARGPRGDGPAARRAGRAAGARRAARAGREARGRVSAGGLRALAPGKVNLSLLLGPRRADGRHELVTLVQALSLADELRLEPATGTADEVLCPEVEGENLAGRALA